MSFSEAGRSGGGKRVKTVTRSFRINEEAFSALEDEAKKRKMSANTLLNQLILSFADFDRYFMKVGLMKISSITLKKLIEGSSDDVIKKAAQTDATDVAPSIILAKHGKMTLETTFEYLQALFEYAIPIEFEYNETQSPNGRIITIFHRFGKQGSIYMESFLKTLFERVGYSPKIRTTEHSVEFEIVSGRERTVVDNSSF